MPEGRPDPIRIDVSHLVRASVTSLHAHLVTRPTGRAVRLAIETQLAEVGDPAVSLIDMSDVSVLDFSCADEVVAKLLQRYLPDDRPHDAFFVFRGVDERHRDPIETVLERQSLAAIAQRDDGGFDLVGTRTPEEDLAWTRLEHEGSLPVSVLDDGATGLGAGLHRLLERRLVFRDHVLGQLHALGQLVLALEG